MPTLQSFLPHHPTPDQQSAVQALEEFLGGKGQLFVLKGYAGTGKTTLLKALADYREDQKRKCVLMAPTGRAAMIIREKSKKEASTIHRAIYNFDDMDEVMEGTSYKLRFRLFPNQDDADCLYLVDEASMISDYYSENEFTVFGSGRLLQDLLKYCLTGASNRKIVFIGDDAQLPPVVGNNSSPALDADYLASLTGLPVQSALLSQVVRQEKHSKVLGLATRLRKALQKESFNMFRINEDGEQVVAVDRADFIEIYTKKAAENGLDNLIVITHSNNLARKYNQIIRERRYGADIDQLHKRDRLLITRNNYHGLIELYNGMFAEVVEVGPVVYSCSPVFYAGGGSKKSVQRKLDFRQIRVKVKDLKGNEHVISTTLIDHFLYSDEPTLDPLDQRALYIDFKERMRKKGIKPGSREFKMNVRSDKYFNALQAKFGYAITCHKSQGGEWPFVFVDFNVYMGKVGPSFFRWAYTAITRSSGILAAVDSPDFNAFSLLSIRDIQIKPDLWQKAFYAVTGASDPFLFVENRISKLNSAFEREGIQYNWDRGEWYLFCRCKLRDEAAAFKLHFKKSGFSRMQFTEEVGPDFKALLRELLRDSLIPTDIPFEPKFPAMKDLYSSLKTILSNEQAVLTNIIQHEYSDKFYFLKNRSFGMIEFYHNSKMQFTKALPYSAKEDDETVSRVIESLRKII